MEFLKNLIQVFKIKSARAHRSATIRFNAFCEMVNELLPFVLPFAVEHFPELQGYLPTNVFTNVMRVILIANIIYRFKTSKPLEEK